MKIEMTFLKSKVARRIFLFFVVGALIPITALAVLAFIQITDTMKMQDRQKLEYTNKQLGMAVMERLALADATLDTIASRYMQEPSHDNILYSEKWHDDIQNLFSSVAIHYQSGQSRQILGHPQSPIALSNAHSEYLSAGNSLLLTRNQHDEQLKVLMLVAVDPGHSESGVLAGALNPSFLKTILNHSLLPAGARICILDQNNHVIYSSTHDPFQFLERVLVEMKSSSWGHFEWTDGGIDHLTAYWPIFLKFKYLSPQWTVLTSVARTSVFARISDFKMKFLFIILISMWVVLLLSLILIRRNLIPLEQLKEGTQRIAMNDFTGSVTIKSRDEFEDLADSFNMMAAKLEHRFDTLATISEIDRAVLADVNVDQLIRTVIPHIPKIIKSDIVGISLFKNSHVPALHTYMQGPNPGAIQYIEDTDISRDEIDLLANMPEGRTLTALEPYPAYLLPFTKQGYTLFSLSPILPDRTLAGFIVMANSNGIPVTDDDRQTARRLADQLAVALANTHLVEELRQLNHNVIQSLARAIDAKSRWTVGHSERVAQLAMKIGHALGLSDIEIDTLRISGLLHDVGMIGIPNAIIDKTDNLTDEERRIMQEHPRIGVSILEPLGSRRDIIKLVLQHHERFDGRGYPEGLTGHDICLGARILAVADTYDALVADRPYRTGMHPTDARAIITREMSAQFDPEIVQTFLRIRDTDAVRKEYRYP
jgi:putative nucleotidyltransferase with HDIG domain